MFFNDVKQLLKKLTLVIGERLAWGISIEMRNMGAALLDTSLKSSTINKSLMRKYIKTMPKYKIM